MRVISSIFSFVVYSERNKKLRVKKIEPGEQVERIKGSDLWIAMRSKGE